MGNFYQHQIWGLYLFSFTALSFIIVLLQFPDVADFINSQGSLSASAIFIGAMLYAFGNVLPDIDHDKSEVLKRIKYFSTSTLLMIFAIAAFVAFVFQRFLLATIFALLAVFGSSIFFYLFERLAKRTVHWGHFHSLIAGLLVGLVTLVLFLPFFNLFWAAYIGISITEGFYLHLICDQFYSASRGKNWKRRAFKVWSNKWDPIKVDLPIILGAIILIVFVIYAILANLIQIPFLV